MKKRVQFPVKDYWFCFCPKVWTPWPQLKTSYTGLITVWPWCWWPFFSNWFLLNIEEDHFNCLFLIICRWNLFRTICANSRKVGLGKFLSPYKDIPVDLSRPEPHPHFFMFAHWSAMQERSIINACRFYSLQWLLHMYV